MTEVLLPKGIMRKLSEEEMKEYVAPFKNEGEDRRPTLFLPREIPIEGDPKVSIFIVSSFIIHFFSLSLSNKDEEMTILVVLCKFLV